MQKKAIRAISGSKYNAHTNPLYLDLNILKIDDIYNLETVKFVYKFKNKILPTPLNHLFLPNDQVYERRTRQSNNFHVTKCRTTLATQHIKRNGPLIWNNLPTNIKLLPQIDMKQFSSHVTKFYIEQYKPI